MGTRWLMASGLSASSPPSSRSACHSKICEVSLRRSCVGVLQARSRQLGVTHPRSDRHFRSTIDQAVRLAVDRGVHRGRPGVRASGRHDHRAGRSPDETILRREYSCAAPRVDCVGEIVARRRAELDRIWVGLSKRPTRPGCPTGYSDPGCARCSRRRDRGSRSGR